MEFRQFCKIKHDPENGLYGDCLRACVATMVGHDVPHFADGGNAEKCNDYLRDHMKTLNLAPVTFSIPGEVKSSEVLNFMKLQNPNVKYLLFCKCGGIDHVVICQNDKVIHNPAWAPYEISGPNSNNIWSIMVFTGFV